MPLITIEEISHFKATKRPLIGLDVGDKTVGISISDTTWLIASPLTLIRRSKPSKDFSDIQKIINDRKAVAVVVGLPINMNGTEGPQGGKVRSFVDQLLSVIDIPVCFWDERLSTMAVTRTMLEADMSRKRRSEVVDKLAATYILQGALDWIRNQKG
jgi:putative Holliday junction resolvase